MNPQQTEHVMQKSIHYTKSVNEMQKSLQPFKEELERQHLDSIKYFAVISGALATFSLTLFSSNLEKLNGLLISGVALLLLNVIFSFTYLIRRLTKSANHVREIEKNDLMPFQEINYDTFKCLKGEITFEEWQKKNQEFDELVKDKVGIKPEPMGPMNYTDDAILVVLSVAIVLIILSFVLPLIRSNIRVNTKMYTNTVQRK